MKSKKAKAATKRGVVSAPGCSTTPDQFFLQMQKIREEVGDNEAIAHARMDDLMCRVLVELGYRDGVGVFGMQEKWYE